MEERAIKSLAEFQEVITQLEGDFAYRGQINAEWAVESGAYSRLKDNNDKDILKYTNNIISKAKAYTQDIKDNQNDIDLLAELQHYGCATPLIDFSYNALIALWFAIENTESGGKVFCLNTANNDKLLELSADDTKEPLDSILKLRIRDDSEVYTLGKWQPSLNNNRIIKQDSVFVFNAEGQIKNDEFAKIITIDKGSKQKIQTELKKLSNLTDTTIYPDFYGFANSNARNKKYQEPTSKELNAKGMQQHQQGEYQKAIEYYELALESDLKTYGEQHPRVATYRNNLGVAWQLLGEYQKAIDYYELALASDLKTYGEQHPDVARDRNNLGGAWQSLGEYQKAIDYYELALASDLKTYGEQHPDVARDRTNLGSAWQSLGKYQKAIDYYKEALAIFHKVFGGTHPNIEIIQKNLQTTEENLKKENKK